MEVKKAIPKEDGNQRTTYSSPYGAPNVSAPKSKKVFLGGLAPETEDKDVEEAFSEYPIERVEIMTHQETEKPRGFGFITFTGHEVAAQVCHKKFFKIRVI